MSEKVYRTMGGAGASGIAVGVVVLVTGIVSCIFLIVQGALLLKISISVLI